MKLTINDVSVPLEILSPNEASFEIPEISDDQVQYAVFQYSKAIIARFALVSTSGSVTTSLAWVQDLGGDVLIVNKTASWSVMCVHD